MHQNEHQGPLLPQYVIRCFYLHLLRDARTETPTRKHEKVHEESAFTVYIQNVHRGIHQQSKSKVGATTKSNPSPNLYECGYLPPNTTDLEKIRRIEDGNQHARIVHNRRRQYIGLTQTVRRIFPTVALAPPKNTKKQNKTRNNTIGYSPGERRRNRKERIYYKHE